MRFARLARAAALAVLCLALLTVVPGCWRAKSAGTPSLPTAGSSAPGAADASGTATATPSTKNPAPTGSTGAAGGTTGSGSSGGTSSGKTGGGGKTGTSLPTVTGQGMPVQLIWWNDTKSKPAGGWEIVYGSKSIKPSGTKGKSSIGPIPFNQSAALIIYPDGRKGKKIVAPFTVTSDMQANSEQDAIHVEVSDASVRILGNPMHNVDQTYPRY